MILRRLLTITILLTSTIWSQAQQINPVPDYVFRNQMSVGRNAVTDTAAYFSIGPRYGATKGFMPPIVGDTATFSSGKRNGLLIFSVQKNKFLYWDSVRVQWSDMAGSSGSYIVAGDTASMLTPYLRKADTTAMLLPYIRHAGFGLTKSGQSFLVDTLNIATRAWRQKGIDSVASLISGGTIGGSGTTNYVPKFTASTTIGNSQIFDNGTNVGIGTASPSTLLAISKTGAGTIGPNLRLHNTSARQTGNSARISFAPNSDYTGTTTAAYIDVIDTEGIPANPSAMAFGVGAGGSPTERLRITSGGDVGIGTSTPGAKMEVNLASGVNIITARGPQYAQVRHTDGVRTFFTQVYDNVGFLGMESNTPLVFGTNNTERLRIFANGRVGINTTTDAGYQLDVNGSMRSVNGAQFATTAGNVGIGTTSPQVKLVVSNGGNLGLEVDPTNTGGTVLNMFAYDRVAAVYRTIALNSGGGDVAIGSTSASYKLDINGTLRSVNGANFATTSGNVGIGVTSPEAKLTVNAPLAAEAGSTSYGSALIRGINYTLSNTQRGIIDIETTDVGGQNKGGTLTFSNNYTQFGNNLHYVGAALKAGTETAVNTDQTTYLAFSTNNGGTLAEKMRITASGNVGIGTASPISILNIKQSSATSSAIVLENTSTGRAVLELVNNETAPNNNNWDIEVGRGNTRNLAIRDNLGGERLRINSSGEFIIDASGTDAGDYKLQVVGNARIGTGKLDIASNTTFGLGVARSGTSEVAGQIYNSNGILYLGAESSAGGQIFSGSSAYAAVIGSGANYPLQFAVNNTIRGGFNTGGELLINTTSDQGAYVIQANGSVYNTGQVTRGQFTVIGTSAQLFVDSTTNLSTFYGTQFLTGSNNSPFLGGVIGWNTSGNVNAIDIYINNTASGSNSNFMQLGDGTNNFKVTKDAGIITANPSSGTAAKWRLGSRQAGTVELDTTQFIEVEIGGTFYRLAIVTPL